MELTVIAGYLGAALLGFLIGIFLRPKRSDGVLRVDVSDPMKDKYLMEFHIPLDTIPSKKRVMLDVRTTVENP